MFQNKFCQKLFLCLTIILVMSLQFSIVSANSTLKDVKDTDWYYDHIDPLTSKNIISGFPDGTFRPNSILQKDQLIKMILVANGYSLDLSPDYWAKNYIEQAKILQWIGEDFATDYTTPISRYDTCSLMIRSLPATTKYPDNLLDYSAYIKGFDSIPERYQTDVLKAYSLGLITGYPDGSFQGDKTLTRAQASAILHRLLNENIRPFPLNPKDLNKLNTALSSSNIGNLEDVKIENNKLLFYDMNQWITLYDTDLNENIANIGQQILVDLASFIYDEELTQYSLNIQLDQGNYYLYIEKDELKLVSLEANPNSNQVQIDLPFHETDMTTATTINDLLLAIVNNLPTTDVNDIYHYILEERDLNLSVNPESTQKEFTDIELTVTNMQKTTLVDIKIK